MNKLYFYDIDTGVLIKAPSRLYDEKEILNYKELKDEDEMVFKNGVTDVAPPDRMSLYPGISPIYDESTKIWTEDSGAVSIYLEKLKINIEKSENQILREDLITSNLSTDATIALLLHRMQKLEGGV